MIKKLVLAVCFLAMFCLALQSPTPIFAQNAPQPSPAPLKNVSDACSAAAAGHVRCLALHVQVPQQKGISYAASKNRTPSGFGPADLRSAYVLPTNAGSGQTVAIVDAFNDPNAEKDLAVYRAQYGLPACTTANHCFRKVDENGGTHYPQNDGGWSQEIALDIEMVSAICPKCHILLVEASDATYDDMGKAVNTAARLGANAISNSYGGDEFSGETTYETKYYRHPGIAITASAGDNSYGTMFPAASRYVTAVGGTSLTRVKTTRGWSESAWDGTGSGCSSFIAKPSWQHDTGCANRTVADVSAVADPQTPVAVYDSYAYQGQSGWMLFGGTSVSAPIIAGIYALAGNAKQLNYASSFYSHTSKLNDVTSGSNGVCDVNYLCQSIPSYDGPTGLGTPNGVGAF